MLFYKLLIEDIRDCTPEYGRGAFWWLGQMAFCLKLGCKTLYFDLYLKDDAHRLFPPPLDAAAVYDADLIFGTHDHDDHIDYDTWRKVAAASPQARFVVPGNLAECLSEKLGIDLDRFVPIEDGETIDLQGVQITGIKAAHERLSPDADNRYANMIYVVRANGLLICHTGDTCIYEGLQTALNNEGRFDLMMLPINGRDAKRLRRNCIGNMTYQEAVDLAGELQPKLCAPCHYDMFEGNTENPMLFANYMEIKYPNQAFWIGAHATRVDF